MIAGGKKIPELDALHLAHNAISDGAAGVDMGRNIFQADSPIDMIKTVRTVVVDGLNPDDAYKQYQNFLVVLSIPD